MHRTKLRVRLSETDAKGVVYYAQYFVFFDISRLELLRKTRVEPLTFEHLQLHFVAAEATCKYHASAKFDDLLELRVGISNLGKSSIVYSHEVRRESNRRLLVEGTVVDVLVDRSGKPARIPEEIREKLSLYLMPGSARLNP
jgi:acyl-CoA thioester hydrolase